MGSLVARRLKAEGCREIVVVNGRTMGTPEVAVALANADIIVTSTGASDFVLTNENIGAAMLPRPNRPLFIVDIAVPRGLRSRRPH